MIPKYQKRANYAAWAFFGGMALIFLSIAITPQSTGQDTDTDAWLVKTLSVISMVLAMSGYYYGMFAYVLAKGQPARYGVFLPFLGLIGLIILLSLSDKAADPAAAEAALRKIDESARIRWLRSLRRPDWLASAAARVISVWMLFDAADSGHGADYFTLLRWAVLSACAFTAYLSYKTHRVWTWVFVITALFFQPFLPVHLVRDTWDDIDLCLAFVLLVSLWFVPGPVPAPGGAGVETSKG
jgi:hypothetical protein